MNELSIIIPCISTTEYLPQFLDTLVVHLMENPSDIDCIVVTHEGVLEPEIIIAHTRKHYPWLRLAIVQRKGSTRNFGTLARFGIAYSTSRYVVLVSPYGEDDVSIIPRMLAAIRQGTQVVQATRYTAEASSHSLPLRFRIYQFLYRFLTRAFLGFSITDSTYGFKMFDRTFMQALGLTQNGYSICPEITFKGLLAGGRVEYISCTMRSVPSNKDFKLHREGLGYFWVLVRSIAHRWGIPWF
ncbi:MAG: hypothetical protein Q7S16_00085 [bacterium]|nr:hypothetical protein [bacterium]